MRRNWMGPKMRPSDLYGFAPVVARLTLQERLRNAGSPINCQAADEIDRLNKLLTETQDKLRQIANIAN